MKGISGVGGLSNHNLIASYSEKQVILDEAGKRKGAFLVVQLDQSNMKKADVEAGKGDSDPYLVHQKNKESGTTVSTYYADSQLKAMEDAGKIVPQTNDLTLIAFNGSIKKSTPQYGGSKYIVDTSVALAPSTNKRLDKNVLARQAAVAEKTREINAANRAAEKQATADEPNVETEQAKDAQVEA